MGMDVYGKAAVSETGEYFRRSVWGWRPLAQYVLDQHPKIAEGCRSWHSNDGDGLDADGATALAEALRADVASGRAERYIAKRNARIAALPREQCHICEGRGRRTREDDRRLVPHIVAAGKWIAPEGGQACNGCRGKGSRPNPESHYGLDLDDLTDFADFLADSGGFEIR